MPLRITIRRLMLVVAAAAVLSWGVVSLGARAWHTHRLVWVAKAHDAKARRVRATTANVIDHHRRGRARVRATEDALAEFRAIGERHAAKLERLRDEALRDAWAPWGY